MDVGLAARRGPGDVVSSLNRVLPPGLKILTAAGLPGAPAPPRVEQTLYQVASRDSAVCRRVGGRFSQLPGNFR